MLTNSETQLASAYYNVRIGGDMALLKGMMRLLIERDDAASAAGRPSLLDDEFIQTHTVGFDELRRDVLNSEWKDIERISGLSQTQIAELADAYAAADRTIICYGMGITQHEHGTQNVQQLVNLLLMKVTLASFGAGICPLRGHSNVQGDRTVGITEKPSAEFLARPVSAMVSPHLMHWTCCNCQHASNMYGASSSIDLHGGQLCAGNARSGSERCTVNAIRFGCTRSH